MINGKLNILSDCNKKTINYGIYNYEKDEKQQLDIITKNTSFIYKRNNHAYHNINIKNWQEDELFIMFLVVMLKKEV